MGVFLAPSDWPSGEGALQLTLDGQELEAVPMTFGAVDELQVDGVHGEMTVHVSLPDGAPIEGKVTAVIRVEQAGQTVRPAVSALGVVLVLPDGRAETMTISRWDPDTATLIATRQASSGAGVMLGLLGAVVVLWVSGVFPLFIASLMVPVVIVLGGVDTATGALAPFFHPIIALFFAGFLMAEAMRRVGLDQRLARAIVRRARGGPVGLFATLVATSAFLSMWMSNTAAVALLLPIVLTITAPMESPGFQRAAVLGVAYAATIGGVGSAIGTPANLLAIEFLGDYAGREITFLEWFAFGAPVLLLALPVIALHLWHRLGAEVDPKLFERARSTAQSATAVATPIGRGEAEVIGVIVLVALTWLTAGWHGMDTGIVALAGVVLLGGLGHLNTDDLGRISWASLLTFGGGLTLGLSLTQSGVADWAATQLQGLEGWPEPVALAAVAVVALGMTTVASNTATAAMLIPLAIPLAGVLGLDPTVLVLVIAMASSVDFALVIGTPTTMLAYSTGLFRTTDILRNGAALDAAGVIIVTGVATVVWPWLGLV